MAIFAGSRYQVSPNAMTANWRERCQKEWIASIRFFVKRAQIEKRVSYLKEAGYSPVVKPKDYMDFDQYARLHDLKAPGVNFTPIVSNLKKTESTGKRFSIVKPIPNEIKKILYDLDGTRNT